MKSITELLSLEKKYKEEKQKIFLDAEKEQAKIQKEYQLKKEELQNTLNQKEVIIKEEVEKKVNNLQNDIHDRVESLSFDKESVQKIIISSLNY